MSAAFITETELRELWRHGRGEVPIFPAGTRFSPSALDFLKDHGLEACAAGAPPVAEAAPPTPEPGQGGAGVAAAGEAATGELERKTLPRMKLRGRVDALRAQILLAGARARGSGFASVASALDALAAYCGEIIAAERQARPVAPLALPGRTQEELDELAGWPDGHLASAEGGPGPEDHEVVHWLNLVRAQALEVEVAALEAFSPDWPELWALGRALAEALGRVASAAHALGLAWKAEEQRGAGP